MKGLRRIAAAPLLLLCLICLIGSVRMFRNELPDSIFLLPMEGFPVLLAVSGLVRWMRKPRPAGHPGGD
jgi:hypothetical protein